MLKGLKKINVSTTHFIKKLNLVLSVYSDLDYQLSFKRMCQKNRWMLIAQPMWITPGALRKPKGPNLLDNWDKR